MVNVNFEIKNIYFGGILLVKSGIYNIV